MSIQVNNISKEFNQCTGSNYICYEKYLDDFQKIQKSKLLINKFYEIVTYDMFSGEIKRRLDYYLRKNQIKNTKIIPLEFINWIKLT